MLSTDSVKKVICNYLSKEDEPNLYIPTYKCTQDEYL